MKRSKGRKLNRLPGYDYSTPGWYFVTICVKNMNCVFGEVVNGEIILNNHGRVVKRQWNWLGERYKYVELDEFVIMPNHIHGILIINNLESVAVETISNIRTFRDCAVGTTLELSLHNRRHNLLSKTMNAFKTTSSKQIRIYNPNFRWQRSFYDHIIDFEKNELTNIRDYIKNNPAKWDWNRENPESMWY